MSDLIERLRMACSLPTGLYGEAADELERLQRENEELRQRLEIDPRTKYDGIACRDETIKILEREVAQQGFYNEELRKQCDTLEFRAGDALDRAARAEQENEEVMRQKAYQYQRAKKAEEELAALKASTEPFAWASKYAVQLKESGALGAEVSFVNLGWTDQIELFTTPPTATALLESLGDWVHERMQQADADYHNHGDDTAEVYATLKMVLSKIESMIERENHGRHE